MANVIPDPEIAAAIEVLRKNFLESGQYVKAWYETIQPSTTLGERDKYELIITIGSKR